MEKSKPCCGNCDGKTEKKLDSKRAYLFCDTRNKTVNPNELCQWHDYDKGKSQS